MAITPVPPLDRTSPTFRADVDTFFGSRIPVFVSEANALAANLNSIAAGGAYAIPLVVKTQAAIGGATGALAANSDAASMQAATVIFVDAVDSRGANFRDMITGLFNNVTSTIKGSIRIVKVGDPSSWITYQVLSWSPNTTYGQLAVTYSGSSSANPFAVGDSVVMHFQRTGDKGDKGDNGTSITPILWVRDEKPSGTTPGNPVQGINTRVLNTTVRNTLTGASLASNRVIIPAGTYRFRGSAPANGVGAHQAFIYNITAGSVLLYGTTEYTSGQATTRSLFACDVTLFSATTLELRHWCGTSSGSLGSPAGSGASETYSELFFEKVG